MTTAPTAFTMRFPAPDELLNANDRRHHHNRSAVTAQWRGSANLWARHHKAPKGLQRARVDVAFIFPTNRRRDASNLHPTVKAIVDGIVTDYGLLPDDNDTHLDGPHIAPTRVDASLRVPHVTVTITEVPR